MDDAGNTREQLMAANAALRQYVATLEAVRTEHVQTEQARKQAQEALEQRVMPRTAALLESEAQYRQLLDESLQGILIHRDDRALFVNQAYADILGYATPDEIYRLDTLNTLIAPHERERLTGYRDTRLAEEPAPSFYEYQGVRKDGSLLWLDMTVRVVSWKGRPATQSIITDITARKRTEAALHDSRQFLQSTLDALSAHIAILDETGTIISVNAAWQQFAQGQGLRDPSHAVGTNYLAICDRVTGSDATDASAMAQGIREVVARQRAFFALEYACHSPDEQRWFVARVTCFERQRASRIVVAHETITERKRSEEALRQSEARYRTLVDTIPHGIQENDVSGTITFSNRAHARLLGYADGELLGKAIWDVLASESERDDLRAYLARLVREQPSPTPYVTQDQTKDGRLIEVQVDWNYKRDIRGRVTGFISVISDITERTRLEAQLRQSQKMEAIGTLAGGIAHEFNNVLAAILGFVDLAQDEVPQGSSAGSYLRETLRAGYRAKDLVQQILAFSAQSDQARELLPFSLLLQEGLTLLRASLPTTIAMHQHLPEEDTWVLANRTQMHQVVMNLCANAEYAMRETGGLLEIRLDTVDIDHSFDQLPLAISPGPYVRLTIRDTGDGIAPDVLPRIFDPFFTTKGVGEGAGMGLAIVHGIVTSHVGSIAVESTPRVGTTFVIYLPRLLHAVPSATTASEKMLPPGE